MGLSLAVLVAIAAFAFVYAVGQAMDADSGEGSRRGTIGLALLAAFLMFSYTFVCMG